MKTYLTRMEIIKAINNWWYEEIVQLVEHLYVK